MKKLLFTFLILACFYSISCKKDEDTLKIQAFVQSFSLNVENYKVICIVPVDGCASCIDPSLNYAKKNSKGFLLVMSSIYKKSIDYTIDRIQLNHENFISDYHNLALKSGLSTEIAPCFYFLRKGVLIKKVDLFPLTDKTSILKDVDKYLAE
jgi:hypothetical protein